MITDKNGLWFFFKLLQDVEVSTSREQQKQVMIEKAINLKLMCDYVVSCSYGDIVLIISMLHDYVRILDDLRSDNLEYQAYYRDKFLKIANSLSEQIEYDYDEALEKCKKKQFAKNNDDIGEEAIALTVKRGNAKAKQKE